MEHGGRREESDRAADLSVPLRCRPLRREHGVGWSDKHVSTMVALRETGRGLTLEMGETHGRGEVEAEEEKG